jgi:transposase
VEEMSNRIFSEKEIAILSQNQYAKNVSARGITYTDEFKRIFIAENQSGKLPREIFEGHGFDINILGIKRAKSSGDRWRNAFRKDGVCGLRDSRKDRSGRPGGKKLSTEEKYERLKAQINLLKAENELLKKIHFLERGTKIRK